MAWELADEVARWTAPRRLSRLTAGAHYAGALAALGRSDFASAYQRVVGVSPVGDIPSYQPFAAWAVPDLVEAALRTRRQADAVAHARAAWKVGEFRRLGTQSWVSRTAAALRATGRAVSDADNGGHVALTANELEIARLAAARLSNRQIGDRLFMSHRTVASHYGAVVPYRSRSGPVNAKHATVRTKCFAFPNLRGAVGTRRGCSSQLRVS